MNRRDFLILGGVAPLVVPLVTPPARAEKPDIDGILHDPDAPESGNSNGDTWVVSFFDYNCPFCKKSDPVLKKIVQQDGNIRLIYKDWPILTKASVYGAHLALGSKYQGRYEIAHDALMGVPGHNIAEKAMRDAVAASGIDMDRLQLDLKRNMEAITKLLRRNKAQAASIGLPGTPVYLIGDRAYPNALDETEFKKALVRARTDQPS